MDKLQSPCVEALAVQPFLRRLSAVDRVTKARMADICHVNSYLVGSARFESALNMAVIPITCQHAIVGYGLSGVPLGYRHTLAVGMMTAYGSINRTLIISEMTPDHRLINTAEGMVLQLFG